MSDDKIKLPIKVVVSHEVKEPTLMLSPMDYDRLQEILMDEENAVEAWKFQRMLDGLAGQTK